ncbi:MAG: C25 family cysteine peptidase [Candidatus Thermoplasmatota archaeon]|nr:C25 family cysteine peptidase [Candidatus Thermoplasmatota archaeon]
MHLHGLKTICVKLSITLLILILISPGLFGIELSFTNRSPNKKDEHQSLTPSYRLLIISPAEFSTILSTLVDHKNEMGMKTRLVTLDDVYDQMFWHGRDNAEKIKYFIKQSIEYWHIEYVLLVGDFRLMPIRYVHNQDIQRGYNEPVFISELYYADMYNDDGSFSCWDSNSNGIYSEWYDDGISTSAVDQPIDLYPDVAVGRLACRNKAEVKIMVDKIITYETTAYGSNWANNFLVCAGDTYPHLPSNEGEENTQRALENMTDYNHIRLWASDGTFTGVRDIISVFNDGIGFAFFDGHASPFRWAVHPPGDASTWINGLSILTMSFLRNKDEYPIVLVGGCHNLQFDVHFQKIFQDPFFYYTWIPECWGWKLTRTIHGGSVATLGCTGLGMTREDKDSFSGASDYLEPSFFYQIGVNNSKYLGDAWMNTITMYLEKYPIDWNTPAAWDYAIDAKTVQQWVLLGDPSLKIGGYP